MFEIRLVDNSDKVISDLEKKIANALEKCGMTAEGYAKLKCPVRTGRLRNSITHATSGRAEYIGTNVEYAASVEYGARGRKPKPYLKSSIVDHLETYKTILEQELSD